MNEQSPKYRVILHALDGETYCSTPVPGEELDAVSSEILDALDEGKGIITLPGVPLGILVRAAAVVAMDLEEVGE